MTASTVSNLRYNPSSASLPCPTPHSTALTRGEILLETRAHSAWGAGVTAQMYLPIARDHAWTQLTDYPRWVQFFPDITQSRILERSPSQGQSTRKRLYQAASKSFLFLTVQVEAYLQVVETANQRIQFHLEERGSFHDFQADLQLQDLADGVLLTYSVEATPTIPVPSPFIQQAIHLDLPNNMRTMRQVLVS